MTYNPLLQTYQELWAKYGVEKKPSPGSLTTPTIVSQEDAVKWSLRLREFLEAKAKEIGIEADKMRRIFKTAGLLVPKVERGTETMLYSTLSVSYAALGRKGYDKEASKDIEQFGLLFDFKSVDDLFLSDESDISSVYLFE